MIELLVEILYDQLRSLLTSMVALIDNQTHKIDSKIKVYKTTLGDFLVFLRRIASCPQIQTLMSSAKWTDLLVNIVQHDQKQGALVAIDDLRARLLALQLLTTVLQNCRPANHHKQVCIRPLLISFELAIVY